MRGGARQARIDDDDVRLVEFSAFDEMLQRHRMGFGRIAAHDDLRLSIANVGVAVGHRAVAPGIGHAGDGGRMADARLMVGVVGAPERAELTEQDVYKRQPQGRAFFIADRGGRLFGGPHHLARGGAGLHFLIVPEPMALLGPVDVDGTIGHRLEGALHTDRAHIEMDEHGGDKEHRNGCLLYTSRCV